MSVKDWDGTHYLPLHLIQLSPLLDFLGSSLEA